MGKHTGANELCHLRIERTEIDQLLDGELVLFELTDGDGRTVDGYRANNSIHARAIWQARVDRGRIGVDAAPEGKDDAVDHAQDMIVVVKRDRAFHQFALFLNEYFLGPVHHHFTNILILQ